MYKLRTIGPPYESFLLKTGAYRLGSASDSEMVLNDSSVAPYHCEIVVTAKTIAVRNLSPERGMLVDSEKVEYAELKSGQTLRLGEVTLVMEEAAHTAASGSSTGEQTAAGAAEVAKTSARFLKPLALPALVLLGVVGLVLLIRFAATQESRTPQGGWMGRAARPEKPSAADRDKNEPEVKEAEPAPSVEGPEREAGSTPSDPDKPGGAKPSPGERGPGRRPREVTGSPKPAFDPNDPKPPPALDLQAAEREMRQGDYSRAEPLLQRALRNQAKVLGGEHPEVNKTLDTLGHYYQNVGQFAKAEACLEQVAKTTQKIHGGEHPQTAAAFESLGQLHAAAGDFTKSEPLLDRALKIREKSLGPEHPEVADSLSNLAALNSAQGDYAKAKPLLERSLKILEKARKPDHPSVAQSLNDLGEVNRLLRDDTQAEALLQRALQLKESTLRPDDPSIAATLNSLAALHTAKGDHPKAEPLYQRALKIAEGAFGAEDPRTVPNLNKLAELHQKMGEPAKALPLLERASQINNKTPGPEHPETANSLEKQAALQRAMGDPAKADPLLERASKIREKALGPEHPDSVKSLNDLAALHVCQGDPTQGIPLARQAVAAKLKLLAAMLTWASKPQRLAYRDLLNPCDLAASLQAVPELALALLRFKGLVVDSLLEDHRIAQAIRDPKDRAMFDELQATKSQVAQLIFEVPDDFSPMAQQRRQAEKTRLAREADVLERVLAHRLTGLGRARAALDVSVEQVEEAIPAQAALIEWVRYSHCLGDDRWEPRYGAVILASSGEPKWVPLGDAAAIEQNVDQYQKAVRRPIQSQEAPSREAESSPSETRSENSGAAETETAQPSDELSAALQTLYQQLWAPVESSLPAGTKAVLMSPDGALNFVSFATLLAPNNDFLGQKYAISYVASGRDLLRERKAERNGSVLILCSPEFSAQRSGASQSSTNQSGHSLPIALSDRQALAAVRLPPIPGTLREAVSLETSAKKWNWPVKMFGGAGSSEAQLAAVNSPRILHLATHAVALPDSPAVTEAQRDALGGIKLLPERSNAGQSKAVLSVSTSTGLGPSPMLLPNPVHRSAVALAGGQVTLESWERGETSEPGNDGIVTADELGLLNLDGTELLVLSACDAMFGAEKSGEGILSLRRAFVQAGAENLLMTLWPVGDVASAEMLSAFYERFHQTGQAPQALAEAQRDELVRLRKERSLEAAVRQAGAFVLSSNGRQK
ncbi:MAG: tetratricopeptide repeat protein [Verrucomicrobia bacterium]|nr:tetratricopeptide repeat protein [Verrucomicrobiota bacterium]